MKKDSEKDGLTSPQPEEPGYDLTEVGDAALLAVLKNNEENNAENPEENPKENHMEKQDEEEAMKRNESSQNSQSSQSSQSSQNSQPSQSSQSSQNSHPTQPSQPSQSSQTPENSEKFPPSMAARLLRLATAILSGETPEEELLPLLDAANAREAIANARREGEVAGRNALIEERLKPTDTGVPNLSGAAPSGKARPTSIFDIAAEARSF